VVNLGLSLPLMVEPNRDLGIYPMTLGGEIEPADRHPPQI
jgi:hypothetical protein